MILEPCRYRSSDCYENPLTSSGSKELPRRQLAKRPGSTNRSGLGAGLQERKYLMYKKLITACMAIAAFAAFVLPATASATNDPTLTDDGGHVAVGSKILATQVGNSFLRATSSDHKGSIQLTCSTGELTGTVLQNSGGTVEGEITFATFGGELRLAAKEIVVEHRGPVDATWGRPK